MSQTEDGTKDNFIRVKARHPHWSGFLRLSVVDNSVILEPHLSKGKFNEFEGILTVFWENYASETFVELSGEYVQESLLDATSHTDKNFVSKPFLRSRSSQDRIPVNEQ